MKRFLCVSLSFLFIAGCALGITGCDGGSGDESTLTIYTYRDLGDVDGTADKEVKAAIEKKFEQDTGLKINLQVSRYGHTELRDQTAYSMARKASDLDAVIHYVSEDHGCATLPYVTSTQNLVYSVDELLEEHGQDILKYIRQGDDDHNNEMAAFVRVGDEYKMNYIPSVMETNTFGMLVRKDLMEQVKSITGLNPEEYDVTNASGYKNMTLSQFNTLAYALKTNIKNPSLKTVIAAYPWDMNSVFGPVFGTDAYNFQPSSDTTYGAYAPAQFSAGFAEYSDQIHTWAREGIWEKESLEVNDSTRRSWFATGEAAVYAANPYITNLISTGRVVKSAAGLDKYMLIAPLADDRGANSANPVVRGYKKKTDQDALMIPAKESTNAEAVVKYINWLYSDVENYELAMYGVKGTHWAEGSNVSVGGQTYKTWAYPAGKEDDFNANPPYTGLYCILKNINVSNRIRDDYSTSERKWYSMVTDEFPVYASNHPLESIWVGKEPTTLSNQRNNIENNYVEKIRAFIWSGQYINNTQTPSQALAEYIDDKVANCGGYLTWLNQVLSDSLAFKASHFS